MSAPENAINFFDLSRKRKQELEERAEKEEKDSLPNLSLEVFQDHTAVVKLSTPVDYDDELADLINKTRKNRNRMIDLRLYSEFAEKIDQNLIDWQVSEISPTRIDL